MMPGRLCLCESSTDASCGEDLDGLVGPLSSLPLRACLCKYIAEGQSLTEQAEFASRLL